MSKVHKIAVFISHIYGSYQRSVCQGVIDKALEYGYHVDIFTSNDENVLGAYATGEAGILQIPNPDVYDGVILASGTYLIPRLRELVIETLQTFRCPVIDINSPRSPFPGVLLDNNSAIADLVDHLSSVHSLQRISYLGNSAESSISDVRSFHYRSAMKEAGLNDFIRTAEADFSEESMKQALDKLLLEDPQAIICYNDIVAFFVMGELSARGIPVPEQIAVTGCDDLDFGRRITPALTSITFPSYELGQEAFLQLLKHLDETAKAEAPIIRALPRFGASCGCHICRREPSIQFHNQLKNQTDTLESICLKSMNMSAALQGITDLDKGMDVLADFARALPEDQKITGLREFYLCLYSGWEQITNQVRRLTLFEEYTSPDQISLKLALKDQVRLPECTFSRKDCLPDFLRKNGSQVYVFTPLYFGDTSFGYLCQAYENNRISYPFSLVFWLQNINNMLKSISDNINMQLMLNRLEHIYHHDELTGLLNRQSFTAMLPDFVRCASLKKTGLNAIILDLEHLGDINSRYGHREGNFALQVVGQAINSICTKELSACRFEGDQFYLIQMGHSEEDAHETISHIRTYLEHYNQAGAKPFKITVKSGASFTLSCTEDGVMAAFHRAARIAAEKKQPWHPF